MVRRFVAKRKKKKYYKLFLLIIFIYILYQTSIYFINKQRIVNNNQDFILNTIKDNTYPSIYKKDHDNIINRIYALVTRIDPKDPLSILKKSIHYDVVTSSDEEKEIDVIKTSYISNPIPENVETDPLIYIYNTHQLEEYSNNYLEGYDITPSVQMASYLLKTKLEELGLPTLVEEGNITEFMNLNNMDYNASYQASRYYITDVMEKYPNLKLIIDLHRDALTHEKATVKIGGKEYAKILFVVGKVNPNYEQNLSTAIKLNDLIKNQYPTLTRGVITKEGSNVNGIYNQDLSSKMILLEVGGNNSYIEEVINTLEVFSNIVKEYVDGN